MLVKGRMNFLPFMTLLIMYLLSTLFFGLFTSLYLVLYAYPFHITSKNRSPYHAWTVSLPVRFRLGFEYNACEDIRGFHKNR